MGVWSGGLVESRGVGLGSGVRVWDGIMEEGWWVKNE